MCSKGSIRITVKIVLSLLLFKSGFGQSRGSFEQIIIYTDPSCGMNCSRSGGYMKTYVNGVFRDSTLIPCKINNNPVSYKKFIISESSYLKIKSNLTNDTLEYKIYDLNGNLFQEFKAVGWYIDTIGHFKEYHQNGIIKKRGNYYKYKVGERAMFKRDMLNGVIKDGYWPEFDKNGKLIRMTLYDKGIVKEIKTY